MIGILSAVATQYIHSVGLAVCVFRDFMVNGGVHYSHPGFKNAQLQTVNLINKSFSMYSIDTAVKCEQ